MGREEWVFFFSTVAKTLENITIKPILEEVFRGALRRKYGDDENFDVIINPDKGDLEIWRNRIVVEDGKVEVDEIMPLVDKIQETISQNNTVKYATPLSASRIPEIV